MNRLAIYDMDKTITRRATFGPFIIHVIRHHMPWRALFVPFMGLATLAYLLKVIDRSRLKEWNLRLLLGRRIDASWANRLANSFAAETMTSNMLAGALRQIEADRAAGHRIILATASYRIYVDAIADLIGVKDIIATDLIRADAETFIPRIDGGNCYDVAKLDHVRRWLATQGLAREACHIRFYSDHVSDAPCLKFADEAFATNPHPPLRTLARVESWTIHDWA